MLIGVDCHLSLSTYTIITLILDYRAKIFKGRGVWPSAASSVDIAHITELQLDEEGGSSRSVTHLLQNCAGAKFVCVTKT